MILEDVRISTLKILNENSNDGRTRVRGVFQRADELNNNKRVYPKKILARELERLRPMFESRQLVGELDHPSDHVVKLQNASHLITNLYWDGNDVIGEAEILPTPAGKIAEALIRSGVKIGISSRGVGSLTEGVHGKVVNEDFQMLTFDLVADPSTKGAFPSIAESRDIAINFANKYIRPVLGEEVFVALLKDKVDELKENKDTTGLKVILEAFDKDEKGRHKKSTEGREAKDKRKKRSRYVRLMVSNKKRPTQSELAKRKEKSAQAREGKKELNKKKLRKLGQKKGSKVDIKASSMETRKAEIERAGGRSNVYEKLRKRKERSERDSYRKTFKKSLSAADRAKNTFERSKLSKKEAPDAITKVNRMGVTNKPKKLQKIFKLRHAARQIEADKMYQSLTKSKGQAGDLARERKKDEDTDKKKRKGIKD